MLMFIRALRPRGYNTGREDMRKDAMLELETWIASPQTIRLAMGELKSNELECVRTALRNRVSAIRNIP